MHDNGVMKAAIAFNMKRRGKWQGGDQVHTRPGKIHLVAHTVAYIVHHVVVHTGAVVAHLMCHILS